MSLLIAVSVPASGVAAVSPLHIAWTSQLKTGGTGAKKALNFATPAVSGDNVYAGSVGGYLYSINITNGRKVWERKLDGGVASRPLIEGDKLFIGDDKGGVYSVNISTGDINWHAYVGDEVTASPAADEGNVYVATGGNTMVAVDRETGAVKWTSRRPQSFAALTLRGNSSPVVIGRSIFVGNTDGVLVEYGAEDGSKVAVYPVASGKGMFTDIDTSPLIYSAAGGDRLIFSTMEGALLSMDFRTGKEFWSRPIATPNDITPDAGRVYVTAAGKVICLDALSGDAVWEKDLKVRALSPVAVAEKYAAVISTDDKIYLLDKSTGGVVWERHLGGGTYGSPVFASGRLLVLANSGSLFAFKVD